MLTSHIFVTLNVATLTNIFYRSKAQSCKRKLESQFAMRYSDIKQVGSSDSEEDDQTSPAPLVAVCSPVREARPETVPPLWETEPSIWETNPIVHESGPTVLESGPPQINPEPVTHDTTPRCEVPDTLPPPVCTAPTSEYCYPSVTLTPAPDINQFAMLSDTDSTVSTTPEIMCRICRSEPGSEKIISPCYCAGSLQYVHQSCLLKWLKAYDCVNKHHCELCQYEFKLKPKPWMEWRMPALSVTEQRRATCLVVICVLAVLIVLWSINDLVQNIEDSRIYMNWGFWTKLLFIVFGLFILAFQYPTIKYFYLKLRESNQIVLWGEEGEEQELLETGKLKESARQCDK